MTAQILGGALTTPRIEIDVDKIFHNTRTLVHRLAGRGISVTGVTKAFHGSPEIANAFVEAGVRSLGDSRIENIEAMRRANVPALMTLIRSPLPSQVDRVVAHSDVSFNTEIDVINMLSSAAKQANKVHGIVLMVELGDLREGILPSELNKAVEETLALPNVSLKGIGANLACLSGVSPDLRNMSELSVLANSIESKYRLKMDIVSGGNSANLDWVRSGADTGRINELRLGEALLLGRETLHRNVIEGLHTDAFTIVAEVIESKLKPTRPWGELAQTAFGNKPMSQDQGNYATSSLTKKVRTILAIGNQDTDPAGLIPPAGMEILGASGDHLIVDSGNRIFALGAEVRFQPNYSALVRAMSSPVFVRFVKSLLSSGDRELRFA